MFIYIKQLEKGGKNRYIINRVKTDSGEYFEIEFFGRPKPRTIKSAIRKCPRGLKIANEGSLPQMLRDRRINPEPFIKLLLINAFSEIIEGQKCAAVYDKHGTLCSLLLRPLCKTRTLYIVTERPDIYADFYHHSLSTVGTGPIITDKGSLPLGIPALSADKGCHHSGILLGEDGFMPSGDTVTLRGREMSAILCGAEYSVLGDRKAASALPVFLENGSLRLRPSELKKMLDTACYLNI